ncbi:MAG: hypothetical protein U0703_14975 [Anaerolineae bacterium]
MLVSGAVVGLINAGLVHGVKIPRHLCGSRGWLGAHGHGRLFAAAVRHN